MFVVVWVFVLVYFRTPLFICLSHLFIYFIWFQAKFQLLHVTPQRATILKCIELSQEFNTEPIVGLQVLKLYKIYAELTMLKYILYPGYISVYYFLNIIIIFYYFAIYCRYTTNTLKYVVSR